LVFNPTIVFKNGLTYISLSLIQIKEKIFLLVILQHENFYVNPRIDIKMYKLNKSATWLPFILQSKNLYHFYV